MSVLGTVAAGVTGFFTGFNPQAMMLAYSVGSGVDGMINQPDRIGPRLEDLRVQLSQYGATIPFEWGTNRHAGTIIWPRILEAVEHREEESAKGGPDNVTFKYTLSCAVLLCEGPIAGVRRIWANKKIVYDVSESNTGPTQDPRIGAIRFHLGTEDQMMDPLIEATDGPGPAYRGYAYVVFEDYDVSDLNGRPPQWEFEVITKGAEGESTPAIPLGKGSKLAMDPATGYLWTPTDAGVIVYNPTDLSVVTVAGLATLHTSEVSIEYIRGEMWVSAEGNKYAPGPVLHQIDPATYETTGQGYTDYKGAVSKLGTVSYDETYLYLSITNGVGEGTVRIAPGPPYRRELGPDLKPIADLNSSWVFNFVYHPFTKKRVYAGYGGGAELFQGNIKTGGTWGNIGGTANHMISSRLIVRHDTPYLYIANAGSKGVVMYDTNTYALIAAGALDTIVRALFYSPDSNTIYVDTGVDGGVIAYDGDTFHEKGRLKDSGYALGYAKGNTIYLGNETFAAAESTSLPMGRAWIASFGTPSLKADKVLLKDIVADISRRAGLTDDDIDVSELTDLVDGYIVPRQMTARAAIEPLQQAFFFDAVESDDKIKFVKRGKTGAILIPMEDRAAHENGQDVPDSLTITRAFELELPVQCDVEYPDIEADHLIGNQSDRRITKDTRHNLNLQLPIVMTAEKAKSVARTLLYEAWQNQSFKFSTSRKYAHLEPTDLVELPTLAAMYRGRITSKRERPGGIIEWEARVDSVTVYTQTGEGAVPITYPVQEIFKPSTTYLEMLDIPLLRDEDENAGFYVAMGGV